MATRDRVERDAPTARIARAAVACAVPAGASLVVAAAPALCGDLGATRSATRVTARSLAVAARFRSRMARAASGFPGRWRR
ncbi:hypothetical protein IHE55_03165 [Streptomyces pactum]|uniref:Uncharacterized protein n=1 Tax=Streptomyces pactum TaxID=68249 RepID=A0ABS0NFB6_9ACTN|nr:hypothetical protein [Streptomyces pactum]MBH5333856.1 hypothetical protein [Streptomyces pactum]